MSDYQAVITGADLDGSDGFVVKLSSGNPQRGLLIGASGDLNGDGFDDFRVGQEYGDSTYVVFGHAGAWKPTLKPSGLDGAHGFGITDPDGYAAFGCAADAGDINGDGFDDLVVGAKVAQPDADRPGSIYVIFGHAGGWDPSFDLASLDGSNGFRIDGPAHYSTLGMAVAAADVNGDGMADLIGGAYDAHAPAIGYVIFGHAGPWQAASGVDALDGSNGFALTVDSGGHALGASVSSAGDVNHDGFTDFLVRAPHYPGMDTEAYLVFGAGDGHGGSLDLSTLNGTDGVMLTNSSGTFFFADSITTAGDVNGDGFSDIVMGDYVAMPNQPGQAYVVFGKAGDWDATLDMSQLDGGNGFTLTGWVNYQRLGISVSSAGDFNGDGFDDLIVGAQGANGWEGAAYVLFGHPGPWQANINLAALNGNDGFEIVGDHDHAYTGTMVSSAGDVNGDGFGDLMVTTFRGRNHHSGSLAYVIFGHGPGQAVDREGNELGQTIHGGAFGDALSGLGGDDRLLGDRGVDTLDGGQGADTLEGGRGADLLSGGEGADRFVFASTADSKGAAGDLIQDFAAGDLIDLSAVDADPGVDGDQAFILVARLSGHAGELAVQYHEADDRTVIKADVDGDGRAELRIEVTGDAADAGAFVL